MPQAAPVPHKELEVKLGLTPDGLRDLQRNPVLRELNGTPKRTTEVSVYFDTDKHELHKKGLMLRVRRVGSRYLQTIKANAHSAPFERDEWETEIEGEQPNLSLAEGTGSNRSSPKNCVASSSLCLRRACNARCTR
jgi:triphosphatase